MPVLQPADLAAQQWAQLLAITQAEMLPGGRLTSLQDVRKSAHLWTDKVPAAGIQLQKVIEAPYAAQHHRVTTQFVIIVACNSVDTTVGTVLTPANLDDAMAQLQTLVSDGNGNGFAPVLRDPVNRFLNNTASQTGITNIDYQWDLKPGATPQIWAYAFITFEAVATVAI